MPGTTSGQESMLADALQTFFGVVVYHTLLIALVGLLLYHIGLLVLASQDSGVRKRLAVAACLPLAALSFLVASHAIDAAQLECTLRSLKPFWWAQLPLAAAITVGLMMLARFATPKCYAVAAASVLIQSTFACLILLIFILGVTDETAAALLGVIVGGGLYFVLRR